MLQDCPLLGWIINSWIVKQCYLFTHPSLLSIRITDFVTEEKTRDKPLEHLCSGQEQCAHKPCKDESLSLWCELTFIQMIDGSFLQGQEINKS